MRTVDVHRLLGHSNGHVSPDSRVTPRRSTSRELMTEPPAKTVRRHIKVAHGA
jgi:hypothetical protein